LQDMARRRPSTSDEFLEVHGVGDKKLADLGEAFLACLAAHNELAAGHIDLETGHINLETGHINLETGHIAPETEK